MISFLKMTWAVFLLLVLPAPKWAKGVEPPLPRTPGDLWWANAWHKADCKYRNNRTKRRKGLAYERWLLGGDKW